MSRRALLCWAKMIVAAFESFVKKTNFEFSPVFVYMQGPCWMTQKLKIIVFVVPGMAKESNPFSISIWTARQKVMNQAESK